MSKNLGVAGIRRRSSVPRAACLGLVAGCLFAIGGGCEGDAGGSAAVDVTPPVPPEIASQLNAIERLMNGAISGPETSPESLFSESARVHLASRLAYGSREDLAAEIAARRSPATIEFGETEVVLMRPDRVRTVTRVTTTRGEVRSAERISHEWMREGEGWIAREQSYPDWTPLIGEWTRIDDDGERILLRLLPNGQFEIRLLESGVVTGAGTYSAMGEDVSVIPDAVGAGGRGGRAFDLSHRFEFDGSLRFERPPPATAAAADSQSDWEGVWRRRRLVD